MEGLPPSVCSPVDPCCWTANVSCTQLAHSDFSNQVEFRARKMPQRGCPASPWDLCFLVLMTGRLELDGFAPDRTEAPAPCQFLLDKSPSTRLSIGGCTRTTDSRDTIKSALVQHGNGSTLESMETVGVYGITSARPPSCRTA